MQHRVVCVALLDGARVLLGHRAPTRAASPNVWDFPGGHVEPGESRRAALTREAREELGVEIVLDTDVPVFEKLDPEASLELALWATRTWSGTVHNEQPVEHDALGWFTLDECETLNLADESYRPLLRRLLAEGPTAS